MDFFHWDCTMISEKLMEVDDSGFQNVFHMVQNEDRVLVFSHFKRFTKRKYLGDEHIPNLCVWQFHGAEILQIFKSHRATVSEALETISVMTLMSLS